MVSELNIFAQKWSKIAASKKVFTVFFFFICSLLRFKHLLPPLSKVRCSKFLKIQNPWGKVKDRSDIIFEHFLFKNVLKLPQQKKF